jgi:hypothetical protein
VDASRKSHFFDHGAKGRRKNIQTNAIASDNTTTTIMDDFDTDILIRHVMPFVGTNQFRFVAGVNRKFYWAYTAAFTGLFGEKKTLFPCLVSWEHVKLFLNETKEPPSLSLQCGLFQYAARTGNRDMIQFLRAKDCSWDCSTCYVTAAIGDLSMLQWLIERGCPVDCNTFYEAASSGYIHILQWLHQQGRYGFTTMVV